MMLGRFRKPADHLQALERVKQWTRARFALTDDDTILVSEVTCDVPGCVPLETVVGFWTDGRVHHHFTVFKPAQDVTEEDLPPKWLQGALVVTEGLQCSCC